jgi:hypothetical protein
MAISDVISPTLGSLISRQRPDTINAVLKGCVVLNGDPAIVKERRPDAELMPSHGAN